MRYKTIRNLEKICLAGTLSFIPAGTYLQSLNQNDHSGSAFYMGISLSILSWLGGIYFSGLKKDILKRIMREPYSPTMRFFLLEDKLDKYKGV